MTGTVTAYLTTKSSSIYVTFLIFVGCISRFIHVIYNTDDQKGIFGYAYMSSFLNALGINLCIICLALFTKFFASKSKENMRLINFGANMFMYVGCFFMINLFIPKKQLFGTPDYPSYFYWVSMLILSIFSAKFFFLIQKGFLISEQKLKTFISNLIALIGDIRTNHYYKLNKKATQKKLQKNDIDKDSKEMDQKIFNTLKSIVKDEF